MKHLVFNREQLSIEFQDSTLQILLATAQNSENDTECGGVLLGRLFPNSSKIVVTNIIESKDGQSNRFGFSMNVPEIQKVIYDLWEKSNGKITYLGDWHTHPELEPNPSFKDQITFRMNYHGSKIDQNLLLYIIIGTSSIYKQGIWLAVCNGVLLYTLKQSEKNIWSIS